MTMQELIRLVVNRTGLSHERATVVVRMTLEFLKMKLPASVASEIDSTLRHSTTSSEQRIHLEDVLAEN
jgi:hypothetical protein